MKGEYDMFNINTASKAVRTIARRYANKYKAKVAGWNPTANGGVRIEFVDGKSQYVEKSTIAAWEPTPALWSQDRGCE